ncbi:MAG: VWA domain-containing protein [Planctomycetes bacterium]|nr:VWA domain-containing protein [Planctomycetota bacterium]MCB9872123.1 VWA domain-containing protein [Planctomycetota bacterium]
MLRPTCLLHPIVLLCATLPWAAHAPSQDKPADRTALAHRARVAARAIQVFVESYERGLLDPRGQVKLAAGAKPDQRYIQVAVEAGILRLPPLKSQTRHLTLLHRLVAVAELAPGREVVEALLGLAAVGYAHDLYSPRAVQMRELGHFALARSDAFEVWHHIQQVARGLGEAPAVEVEPVVAGPTPDAEQATSEVEIRATALVMRRVAAVRLLGSKPNSVFLVLLEKCLADPDARVRLAAAEALAVRRPSHLLYALARRAAAEPHPMVVMGLVSAIENTLKGDDSEVAMARGLHVMRLLLPMLGRRGWRNDMSLVALQRRYPVKEAIPQLIGLLRAAQAEIDPLLGVVNKDASPVLAGEVFKTLRETTGALLPKDPNRWHAFWEQEKDRIQLVAPYRQRGRNRFATTTGTFFGIGIEGREIVFVIDTSGSMKNPVAQGTAVPRKPRKGNTDKSRRRGDDDERPPSRLDAAKQQVLNAVQGIPTGTRYHLVTFASHVRVWNHDPVQVGPQSFTTLTEALSRVQPSGGTNVFAALLHVLKASQQSFGQRIKNRVDEVFLLSDGEPSASEIEDPAQILELVRNINRYQKIRINTVFTGTGKGAAFMERLARENFGVFVRR